VQYSKPSTERRVIALGYDLTPGQQRILSGVINPACKRLIISCMTRYGKTLVVAIGLLLLICTTPIEVSSKPKRILIIAPTKDYRFPKLFR
jgi:hypothetical protein